MKIIVGAAMTSHKGWYSTNEQWFDITNSKDWKKIFKGKVLFTNVLAEHVFEHLTREEALMSLRLILDHLTLGGRVRIAVPDGFNPNPVYLKHVGIAGIGADAEDHKQLLNSDTLIELLEEAGFVAEILEGYLKNGNLVNKSVDQINGVVIRSRSNDKNMESKAGWDFPYANTSLIIDGVRLA